MGDYREFVERMERAERRRRAVRGLLALLLGGLMALIGNVGGISDRIDDAILGQVPMPLPGPEPKPLQLPYTPRPETGVCAAGEWLMVKADGSWRCEPMAARAGGR